MLRPEEQGRFPDHSFAIATEEARTMETRLRRKMIVNPKRRAAPLAVMEQSNKISTAVRVSSPVNLAFAVLSSATFGWLVRNWHGR
jgi:hypothetical protein